MVSKIIIHDLDEQFENQLVISDNNQIINANSAYATCKGCFGCWLQTPGYCIMKDKLHRLGADVVHADEVVVISRCVYGGLSPQVKKVWDRCIPGILPFFCNRNGKMHHARRYSHEPNITVMFYGDITIDEKALAEKIMKGNGINFGAKNTSVKFVGCADQILEGMSL